jgi:hypothetical protein
MGVSLVYGIRETPNLSIRGINTTVGKTIIHFFRCFPKVSNIEDCIEPVREVGIGISDEP